MTDEEARAAVDAIKAHVRQARALLLDLYEREGWRALGYGTWEECVTSEFGRSRSYMYRQLAAAKLELEVGSEVGNHPESHLRAISETLDEDDQMQEAYSRAVASGATTAAEFKRTAMEVWLVDNLPEGNTLLERAKLGIVPVYDAYRIGKMMAEVSADESAVLSFCTDADLAEMLLNVKVALPELWQEIVATGSLPGVDENVPIGEASARTLKAYLTLDSAERRAQHVEQNRAHYDRKTELVKEVMAKVRVLIAKLRDGNCESAIALADPIGRALDEYDEM